MKLLNKIIFAFSKKQVLLRRQSNIVRRNQLIQLFKDNKKEFIYTALASFCFGLCTSGIADSFKIDELLKENRANKIILNCLYNQSCKAKISSLNIKNDIKKITDIANAYQLKDYITQYPYRYNDASPKMKLKMDSLLELTK